MIIFLDIDGPLIPYRSYMMPNQTQPLVTTFDPAAVGMLNELTKDGWKFVVHSSWLRSVFALANCEREPKSVKEHMLNQGLVDAFHEDWACQWRRSGTRWMAIEDWLEDHPEHKTKPFWILEDEYLRYDWFYKDHVIPVDFNNGMMWSQFVKIKNTGL